MSVEESANERLVLLHHLARACHGPCEDGLRRGVAKLDLLVEDVGMVGVRAGDGRLVQQRLCHKERVGGLIGSASVGVSRCRVGDTGQLVKRVPATQLMCDVNGVLRRPRVVPSQLMETNEDTDIIDASCCAWLHRYSGCTCQPRLSGPTSTPDRQPADRSLRTPPSRRSPSGRQ